MAPARSVGLFETWVKATYRTYLKPFVDTLNDLDKGFAARCLGVGVICFFGAKSTYHSFESNQAAKPLARRWNSLLPATPITMVDKRIEADADMIVYRFKLPNSYDSAGYEPISSVMVSAGGPEWHYRFLNPISPPDAKGYIEFAVGNSRSTRRTPFNLSRLKCGDKAYLGRWMKEWKYTPNKHGEVGIIATASSASIILQMIRAMERDKTDSTKLRVLYCNLEPIIPFKDTDFAEAAKRNPGRFFFKYLVTSAPKNVFSDGYLGTLNTEIIQDSMPAPLVPLQPPIKNKKQATATPTTTTAAAGTSDDTSSDENNLPVVRSHILVSCKRVVQERVCGAHRMGYFHSLGYMEPWFYEYYNTLLHSSGYLQKQVYAFGVVISPLFSS